MPLSIKIKFENELKNMCAEGVIEPLQKCEGAVPNVCVIKKRLKSVVYPLPLIDEILDKIEIFSVDRQKLHEK